MNTTLYNRVEASEFSSPGYYLFRDKEERQHRLIHIHDTADLDHAIAGDFQIIERLDCDEYKRQQEWLNNIADHECTKFIHSDEVTYWRFQKPDTWIFGFDVILTPTSLTITGDLFSNVFDRRGPTNWKNHDYIRGKCKTARQISIIQYEELIWDEPFLWDYEGLPEDYSFQLYVQTWALAAVADKALAKLDEFEAAIPTRNDCLETKCNKCGKGLTLLSVSCGDCTEKKEKENV